MEYKDIQFDDFVNESDGNWSQVCKTCASTYFKNEKLDEVPITCLICGVQDCDNEAEFYIDFYYEKQLE